jgi:hypothetical protein
LHDGWDVPRVAEGWSNYEQMIRRKTAYKVARVQKGVEHVIRACQIGVVNAASVKQPVDTMLWRFFFRDV